jgi:Right handed beta helix region
MRLNSLILPLTLVGAMAMPLLYAAPAQAQASRTWVSGVGDDVNPCSRTAPCKTWAGAISKTANGGEIDALDPGGFGGVTITKSMTLDGGGGQVASTLVAGTNGIVISAQPTDVVIIRNVRLQGLFGNGSNPANSGQSAIVFSAGAKLIVDNCDITGFAVNGVTVNANGFVAINNTRIENVGNAGIGVGATSAQIEVDNVRIYGSKFGVAVANGNKMVFSRSVSSNASTAGLEADPGATLVIDNSVISFNATGISGATQSFTNNRLFGNTAPGTAPTPIPPNPSNPTGQQ